MSWRRKVDEVIHSNVWGEMVNHRGEGLRANYVMAEPPRGRYEVTPTYRYQRQSLPSCSSFFTQRQSGFHKPDGRSCIKRWCSFWWQRRSRVQHAMNLHRRRISARSMVKEARDLPFEFQRREGNDIGNGVDRDHFSPVWKMARLPLQVKVA